MRSRWRPGSSIRRGPTTAGTRSHHPLHRGRPDPGAVRQQGQPLSQHPLPRDPPSDMDGAFEPVRRGQSFVYEFDAEPFGLHLYHCHTVPIKRHIHKGLYGAFIIDPQTGPPAGPRDGDGDERLRHQLRRRERGLRGQYGRLPLSEASHPGAQGRADAGLPGQRDRVRPAQLVPPARQSLPAVSHRDRSAALTSGPTSWRSARASARCSSSRYKHPGPFMFHAHQSEFAELGWSGVFLVQAPLV